MIIIIQTYVFIHVLKLAKACFLRYFYFPTATDSHVCWKMHWGSPVSDVLKANRYKT